MVAEENKMNKFCTNCGAELNGKSKCDKCGKMSGETAVNNLVDKVKNYDYKGKADEMKEKASDIADKAKNYDYKAKTEEVKEAVTNYDYRGEAENIKKGGFKYFWSKHKKLSIAVIVLALAIVIIPNLNKKDAVVNEATTQVNTDSKSSSKAEYKTNLSNEEITNIAIMTFEASYISSSSPQFIGSEIIGQDKYGRCAAILEYDLGGIKGRRKYYVFADGLMKDMTVKTNKGIVEESMNNSTLSESTIKARKEQFGWDTPR